MITKIKKYINEVHEVNCALTSDIIDFIEKEIEPKYDNRLALMREMADKLKHILENVVRESEGYSIPTHSIEFYLEIKDILNRYKKSDDCDHKDVLVDNGDIVYQCIKCGRTKEAKIEFATCPTEEMEGKG